MVFLRLPGDALQGVDAPQAHLQFIASQLFDGLGEEVGPVPLLGDRQVLPGKVQAEEKKGAAQDLGRVFDKVVFDGEAVFDFQGMQSTLESLQPVNGISQDQEQN